MSVDELLQQVMGLSIWGILGAGGIISLAIVIVMIFDFVRRVL